MGLFSFKSINSVMSIWISVVLIAIISIFVVYISHSTYEATLSLSAESMERLDKSLTVSLNDAINSNLGMMRVMATDNITAQSLKTDTAQLDEYFKNMFKAYTGLNSAFIFNAKGVCLAGQNKSGDSFKGKDYSHNDYVQGALSGKENLSSVIAQSQTAQEYVYALAVPAFDETGKVVGGVAVTLDWSQYIKQHILPMRIGKHGYAFILDDKGRVIAHPDQEMMLKDLSNLPFVKEAMVHKSGMQRYTYGGVDKVMVYEPMERTGWIVCMSATEEDLTTAAVAQRNVLLAFGAVAFAALVAIIMFILRHQVIRPLRAIMNYSAMIASGDFRARLEGTFNYEMRNLAENFQETTAVLKNRLGFSDGVLKGITFPVLIVDAQGKVVHTNEAMLKFVGLGGSPAEYHGQTVGYFFYGDDNRGSVVATCLQEKRNVLNLESEITYKTGVRHFLHFDASVIKDLDGEVVGAITVVMDLTAIKDQQKLIEAQHEALAQTAHEAGNISDRVSEATEELSAQIEQSSRGAVVQAQRVSETATAMEEMNASVLEVAKGAGGAAETSGQAKTRAEEGAAMVNRVVQVIAEVRTQAQDLKANMAELGSQAQNIGQVMNVISDIADQTNLLALNAAIEAARAGEAGRGFAVVADEVRKLAEKTMNATKEVGQAISGIQTGTSQNVAKVEQTVATIEETSELANKSGEALKGIVALVDQATDQVRSIATAAEQQSATSEEINKAVDEVNNISAETSDSLRQSAQAVAELTSQAQGLRNLILHMQDGKEDSPRSIPGKAS